MAVPLSRDISEDDNAFLTREHTEEEIHQKLNPLQAVRHDGMHVIFYQKYCHISDKDIIWMVDLSHK